MNIFKLSNNQKIEIPKLSIGITRISQSNSSQFMHGNIPEAAAGLVGTPNVDVSQLSSFSGVPKCVNLVNSFNSRLLLNIAFIFNSADQGSYGVYVPSLDREEKEKILKRKLEQKGYEIKQDGSTLVANDPKGDKAQEEIQRDIDAIWKDLESKGGSVFGVNMSRDTAASNKNAQTCRANYPPEIASVLEKAMNSVTGSSSLEEFFAILEIGSTMVHEATHAMGAKDEAQPESAENAFTQHIVSKVNNIFMGNIKSLHLAPEMLSQVHPLEMTRNAKTSGNWYKFAQGLNYIPKDAGGQRPPSGIGSGGKAGLPDYSMKNRSPSGDAIEGKLSRQYMSPLPPGLSQENDSIELQLRKLTDKDYKPDPRIIHEELLQRDYADESIPYKTIEELMETNRPSPLMKPLKQKASINKVATLFGWMNNLDISDGNTIPGLSDRVMPWEPGCQDFIFDEKRTRELSRYNPEYYDYAGGVYNAVVEPNFTPQLWDDMVSNPANTSPAKRFGSIKRLANEETIPIIKLIKSAKEKILDGEIKATRFIASLDIVKFIANIMSEDNLKLDVFYIDDSSENEKDHLLSIWIYHPDIDQTLIEKVEKSMVDNNSSSVKDIIQDLILPKTNRVAEIVIVAEKLCKDHNFKNVNIIGEYARSKFMGEEYPQVSELTFNCCSAQDGVKFGELLANALGVSKAKYYKDTKMFTFKYNGVKVDFHCGYAPSEIIGLMEENGLNTDNELLVDVCNRDFTINMGVYNLLTRTVDFPIKSFVPKIGEINTLFDPEKLIKINPLIILRAILLRSRYGWSINPKLEKAMIKNSIYLFDKCDAPKISRIRNCIKGWGEGKAKELFEEYGLTKIEEI